jgi:hypothetical protein
MHTPWAGAYPPARLGTHCARRKTVVTTETGGSVSPRICSRDRGDATWAASPSQGASRPCKGIVGAAAPAADAAANSGPAGRFLSP